MAEKEQANQEQPQIKDIDPNSTLEEREAQAIALLDQQEFDVDDPRDNIEKVQKQLDVKGTQEETKTDIQDDVDYKEQYRNIKKEQTKLLKEREDFNKRLESLKSVSPIELLKQLGYDPMKLAEQIVLGTEEDTKSNVNPIEDRLKTIEERIKNEEYENAKQEAFKAIKKDLNDEEHYWLMNEDNPEQIVLDIISEERAKNGYVIKVKEAAEIAEKYLKNKAEKYIEASNNRNNKEPKTKARNLSNIGGSNSTVAWEDLPVEERERIMVKKLEADGLLEEF